MIIADKRLLEALEILRHGGEEALRLFLDMGRRCYEKGGQEFLNNWIGVSAPALPEADRNTVIMGLMQNLYGDGGAFIDTKHESRTLH
jgi:hypothetical protein